MLSPLHPPTVSGVYNFHLHGPLAAWNTSINVKGWRSWGGFLQALLGRFNHHLVIEIFIPARVCFRNQDKTSSTQRGQWLHAHSVA